jgi:gamma-polyglutamate synthase
MDLGLGSSDDLVLVASLVVVGLLAGIGAIERRRHVRDLERVPLRISVNGSRGKSTVTRLLVGAFAEAGRRAIAKTTGTTPRVILGWSGEEEPIHRRPEGANIGEQRRFAREAAQHEAEVAVVECMAVNPDYQETFHHDYVQPQVLVITSTLADHLDVMGPTVEDVAEIFAATIPQGGVVVVGPDEHTEVFRAEAERRGATLIVADDDAVDEAVLHGFDHLVFPANVALALALTDHCGIDRETALRGMRKAPPDPYATRLLRVGDPSAPALFVNGFPANDPTSTIAVWREVLDRGHPEEKLVVIMGCREDRPARNAQFADEVLPALPIDTLVVVGDGAQPVLSAVKDGRIDVREVRDRTGTDPEEVVADLADELHGRVVLGVGNLVGAGVGIVEAFERRIVEE